MNANQDIKITPNNHAIFSLPMVLLELIIINIGNSQISRIINKSGSILLYFFVYTNYKANPFISPYPVGIMRIIDLELITGLCVAPLHTLFSYLQT